MSKTDTLEANAIPYGWDSAPLSQIGEIVSGSTPKTSILRYWNGELVWLTPNDLNNKQKYYDTSTRRISKAGLKSSSARLIPARSVVISSRAPVGYIGIPTIPYTTNQGCKSIIPSNSFSGEYLYYALHSCVSEMLRLGSGTTFTEISKTQLESVEAIFPTDTAEQSKIAEVLSTCDEAIEQTEKIIAKYERIKQGLMQDLLTKGIDEKGNIRSEKTHKFKNSHLGRIPVEWDVVPLGTLCEKIQDGTHFSPKSTSGPYRYVTSKNIRFGFLDLTKSGWISEREHRSIYTRCDTRKGDLLITKDGAKTGNAALNNLEEEVSLLSSVAMIRPNPKQLLPQFLLQVWLFGPTQKRISDTQTGLAITRIVLAAIREFHVVVTSIPEQTRISELLSSVDSVIHNESQELRKLNRIKRGLMQDLLSGEVRVTPLMQKV